ncbi:MAG: NAD kinase [Sphingobacteriaceae bacterium]
MKIAIYGRQFNQSVLPYLQQVFDSLSCYDTEIYLFSGISNFIKAHINYSRDVNIFTTHQDIKKIGIDLLLTLGGDGTLLDTAIFIRDSGIPIIGINFGRLGFLASINKDEISAAIYAVVNRQFTFDKRTLISIETDQRLFKDENFALNDITIHKRDDAAMIVVHAFLNGEFLNSYWGDGIIVATPTGSTAYSLSCGGPIVFPQSGNILVTPVSPHNLNVRPIVVSDNTELMFEVECRSSNYLVSCDSRTEIIDSTIKLTVRKADFSLNLVQLNNESYLSTIRNKLMWGLDARNY